MLYNYSEVHTSKLETNIAKLYLFSLPFRMIIQFEFLIDIFGVTAHYLSFIFHIFGLLFWLVNERGLFKMKGDNKRLILQCTRTILYLNLSSLAMAFIIQNKFGNYAGESALSGVIGMIVYFFQFLLILFYNIRVFQLLSKEVINNILHTTIRILLLIAYFQVLVMNGIGASVYDALNLFGNLNTSNELWKLSLTGIEGATAGSIMGVFIFPYLFSKLAMSERKYIFELLLWIIPLYFTYSTTAYMLFAVNIVVYFLHMLFKSSRPVQYILRFSFFLVLLLSILRVTNVINESVTKDINYLLLNKAIDKNNGSTVSRIMPYYVNWGAFTEFPIFGVGNGLQGYFYTKYFPNWAFYVEGSDVGEFYYRSTKTIANGGAFIPSLLSGYGIVGIIIIIIMSFRFIKQNRSKKGYLGNFYYMFLFGSIAFIVMGFQGGAYGLYFAWFVLSIPFMPKNIKNEKNTISNSVVSI